MKQRRSAVCPRRLTEQGRKARPFPPLTAGAVAHLHSGQSENRKFITQIDVIALGHPITPSFERKPNN